MASARKSIPSAVPSQAVGCACGSDQNVFPKSASSHFEIGGDNPCSRHLSVGWLSAGLMEAAHITGYE
jgi:hypothetical protein